MEPLQIPLSPSPTPATPLHRQLAGEAADRGERAWEAGGDRREFGEETGEGKIEGRTEGGESGDNRGEGAEVGSEEGKEEEEPTQVMELKQGELLTGSEELESDSCFQQVEDKGEIL